MQNTQVQTNNVRNNLCMHSDNFQEATTRNYTPNFFVYTRPSSACKRPFSKARERGDATGLERGRDM